MRRTTLIWTLVAACPLLQAATEPYFAYSPLVVAQGGSLTVAGAGFPVSSAAVNISAGNATGQRTTLAVVALSAGAFTKTITLPSGMTPGLYFVNLVDSSLRAGMNLTGTLTVVPATGPWFSFSPNTAAPGQSIRVTAAGFSPASSGAAVALALSNGQLTLLGAAPLTNGGFSKSFVVPALGANVSANPVVKDALGQMALNATGPLGIGSAAGSVPIGFYPVGPSVNPVTNRIYVPDSGSDVTAVLDGSNNSLIATVPVGALPCASGVDSTRNLAYIANLNSNNISIIDSHNSVTTAAVGKSPCAIAVNPQTNRIFVGNYGDNTISVVDGSTNTVAATISMPSFPAGLGINTVTNRVYSANGFLQSVAVIDGATNQITAQIPVGSVPDAIGVNEATDRVYVGNFFGRSVTVIDGGSNTVLATIPTGSGPAGVAVDPGLNRIYVSNYMGNSISVIDGSTNTVIATIPAGRIPDGVAVNPVTRMVYVANSASNSVSVVSE